MYELRSYWKHTLPAPFTIGEHDNVVSSVYDHERDDPDYVILQRLIDGAWTDVTCVEVAAQIRSACRNSFTASGSPRMALQ